VDAGDERGVSVPIDETNAGVDEDSAELVETTFDCEVELTEATSDCKVELVEISSDREELAELTSGCTELARSELDELADVIVLEISLSV
jgi:hypothetical protein